VTFARAWPGPVAVLLFAVACGPREPDAVQHWRAQESSLQQQIHDLRELVTRAESRALETTGRVAIGVREDVASSLLNVTLPQEQTVAGFVHVRIDSARPYFRGNQAALVGQGTIQVRGTQPAPVELAGHLSDLRVESGTLTARFELDRFEMKDHNAHRIASALLEPLVRHHLGALNSLLPSLEIPVRLEESIPIEGIAEEVVRTRAGTLPLQMTVAKAIPIQERLWVLIDVKAGPWQASGAPEPPS
jgi:hypothetical protein